MSNANGYNVTGNHKSTCMLLPLRNIVSNPSNKSLIWPKYQISCYALVYRQPSHSHSPPIKRPSHLSIINICSPSAVFPLEHKFQYVPNWLHSTTPTASRTAQHNNRTYVHIFDINKMCLIRRSPGGLLDKFSYKYITIIVFVWMESNGNECVCHLTA